MTDQRRVFKVRMLAVLRLKLADGAERPPSLVAVYQRTVSKLERELSA